MKVNLVGVPPKLAPGTYTVVIERIRLSRGTDHEPEATMRIVEPKDHLEKLRAALAADENLTQTNWISAMVVILLSMRDGVFALNATTMAIQGMVAEIQAQKKMDDSFDL